MSRYAGIQLGTVLMSDGYEADNAVASTYGLAHLACWVHAHRYFVETEKFEF